MLTRVPDPALAPFVSRLWLSDTRGTPPPAARELALPTGAMHLAVRLSETPLRVYEDLADPVGRSVGLAVVGGARAGPYVRDISQPVLSIGAMLLPGAAQVLFGVPAGELAHRHTPLEDLLGSDARILWEHLCAAPDPGAKLRCFERFLAQRLPQAGFVHPAIAHALARLPHGVRVDTIVRETGYSSRRFITLFRDATGLSPKLYARVLRVQRALSQMTRSPNTRLVELAIGAGYSDQAHFNREFKQITGLSPGRYRSLSPRRENHVPHS